MEQKFSQRRSGHKTCRTGASPENGFVCGSAEVPCPSHWAKLARARRRKERAGWEESNPRDQRRRVEGSGTRSGLFSAGTAFSQEQCSTKRRRKAWLRASKL